MDEPKYRGHPILPDRAHVDIETNHKTHFKIFSFPIAITGMKCSFQVRFENIYDKVSPPTTFEWRIVKDGEHYWNIYDVNIPKKGDIDNKEFKYTPEISGHYKLFIKVPISDEDKWRVGFHKKDTHFEDGFKTTFRVYSKRELLFTIGTILGIFVGILTVIL